MKNKKIISAVLGIVIFISVAPALTLGTFSGVSRILVEPTLVFNSVYTFRDGMAWVQRDGKVGFVDQYGEIVIPLEFDSISHFFCEGLARVGIGSRETGWKYGFIDMEGNLVIPYTFCWVDCFHDGVARAIIDGKTGVIDTAGQIVVPFEYASINHNWGRIFTDGLAAVRAVGDWQTAAGVIDKAGNIVIPLEYAGVSIRENGLIYAQKGMSPDIRAGILNRHGDIVVPFEHRHISHFYEGLAAVWGDGKTGFIDKTGNFVIPLQHGNVGVRGTDPRWRERWQQHGYFEDGLAVISRGPSSKDPWDTNRMGLIDRMGNIVLPFEFDIIHRFSEGLAVVGAGEIIPPELLQDSIYTVDFDYSFGVIDMNGNFVIPMGKFDFIGNFSNGVAVARIGNYVGLIDRTGNTVLPFEYNQIRFFFESEFATATKNSQTGVIDSNGNVVVPFGEFDSVHNFENGLFVVRKDEKTGLIDIDGNIVRPLMYTSISRISDEMMLGARQDDWRTNGPFDFMDNAGNVIYSMPEDMRLRRCINRNIAQNGGLFWISTGDDGNGPRFGILQIQ